MSLRFVALCAFVCSVPVAAQPAADPYQQAVEARLRGDPAEAVQLLQPVVAADPRNSDAQVQLGYALLALERLSEAGQAFRAALAVAPDYLDARLGLARVAQRRGDSAAARSELASLDPSNPDVRTVRSQLEAESGEAVWSINLDGSYSFLEGAQPDWREGSLQVRYSFDARQAAVGRIEVSRRFDRTDSYLEAGVEQAIGSRTRVYATFGGTPGANFRPEWQLGAGGSFRVTDGGAATVLTLDARHADFPAAEVRTLTPGVEQYLLDGRAWVTARWINLFDEEGGHRSGYLIRGDLQASKRLRLFAGRSDAPDTSEGVVIDTRSYFAGISYDLSARATARLSVTLEDRETGSDRTQIGLGLGWRY